MRNLFITLEYDDHRWKSLLCYNIINKGRFTTAEWLSDGMNQSTQAITYVRTRWHRTAVAATPTPTRIQNPKRWLPPFGIFRLSAYGAATVRKRHRPASIPVRDGLTDRITWFLGKGHEVRYFLFYLSFQQAYLLSLHSNTLLYSSTLKYYYIIYT